MSAHLVYCVFSESGDRPRNSGLRGVEGARVYDLFAGGLGAAVSKLETSPPQEIRNLKDYADVVMEYHKHQTVIPMRFGRTAKEEKEILAALRTRETTLQDRLKALDGCSEMGMRILAQAPRESSMAHPDGKTVRPETGKDFLMARKAFYDRVERVPIQVEEKIETLKRNLAGTYKEYRVEHAGLQTPEPTRDDSTADNGILVSLFFLVPNSSIEKFRSICRQIRFEPDVKTLLSGPWPAFNFVSEIDDSPNF